MVTFIALLSRNVVFTIEDVVNGAGKTILDSDSADADLETRS
jgi:hypothetical protein